MVTALEQAEAALKAGLVVAIPTDTVYGLAVDPTVRGATRRLFDAKGRPGSLELPVLVGGIEQAEDLWRSPLPQQVLMLAGAFWPGALTIVWHRREGLEWDLGGDDSTIGLRCPGPSAALSLIQRVGPLATTSANRHGRVPLSSSSQIEGELGDLVEVVVEGGKLDEPPSTVIDVTGERVRCLRHGAVEYSLIEQVLR